MLKRTQVAREIITTATPASKEINIYRKLRSATKMLLKPGLTNFLVGWIKRVRNTRDGTKSKPSLIRI